MFSMVVTDPDLADILAQVEGAEDVYCLLLTGQRWLIGCHGQGREAMDFDRECTEAIRDAECVRDLLADVELQLE